MTEALITIREQANGECATGITVKGERDPAAGDGEMIRMEVRMFCDGPEAFRALKAAIRNTQPLVTGVGQ